MRAKGKEPKNDKWKAKYKEPEPVDTSGLPELPKAWVWASVGELFLIDSGEAFKKAEYSSRGLSLLQIANVGHGQTRWEQRSYLAESYVISHPHLMLETGDFVIALNRPILGDQLKIAQIMKKDLPAILYQRVGRLRPGEPCATKLFALASDLKTYGADHPDVARDRNNLGFAWQALGEYRKAIRYYEQALASDLTTYGEDYPRLVTYRTNLRMAWAGLYEYEDRLKNQPLDLELPLIGNEFRVRTTQYVHHGVIMQDLLVGHIAFNVPLEMVLNEIAEIHIVLSPRLSADQLQGIVEPAGEKRVRKTRIGDVMEATLQGIGFKIVPTGPQEQIITKNKPTEWRWTIEAIKTGRQPLHLKLAVLITIDGKDRHSFETFSETISVEVSLEHRIRTFLKTWPGIITTVGGAVGTIYAGYVWLRRRRLKKRAMALYDRGIAK